MKRAIDETYNVEIPRIENIVSQSLNECSDQIRQLNTLIYHLENPEGHGIQERVYGTKKQEYKNRLQSLHQCIKEKYKKNEKEILLRQISTKL
ncbi:hypothetical protein PVT01_070005400 [Plasmodium vivax]|uniref:Rh5 coiled-coil domain-containing protein n=1 Tax=Plasmodium vivax TaxID=5855 RepID=A0A1G4GUQ7_PLAVI|nr:hypothetical protein PVT01_070005400 [Plasmodium vivax]